MTLLIDTSVWSLSLRREPPDIPEVRELRRALAGNDLVVTTGVVVQEVLQGLVNEQSRSIVRDRMSRLARIGVDLRDHLAAADTHTACRRVGLQLGTIDALLAALCVRHRLTLLTTDRDFERAASHLGLRVWGEMPPSVVE
jgi:predicted nucleic acid-binding protein